MGFGSVGGRFICQTESSTADPPSPFHVFSSLCRSGQHSWEGLTVSAQSTAPCAAPSLPKPALPGKPVASQFVDGNPPSAARSRASLLWGHLGSQEWKGRALPHLTQACPARGHVSLPQQCAQGMRTETLALLSWPSSPGADEHPGWHQRGQHTKRHRRDSFVDGDVRIY